MDCVDIAHRNDEIERMSPARAEADSVAFRSAMREFASGVAIVTCGEGDRRAGCTATALASLSLTPPSLIVCIDHQAATLARLRESATFAVNILGARHEALAARFAGRGGVKGAARFSHGEWLALATGAPVLSDALAAIDCRIEEIIDRHTHAIVIGAVVAARRGGPGAALVHWRSGFETLE
jgi:flavin reductase (DIM6/NTAB) family NADH-FMN oxidoreductase RutF